MSLTTLKTGCSLLMEESVCPVSDFPDNTEGSKSFVREFLGRPSHVDITGI